MHVPTDINRIITSHLTLQDLPSLPSCKRFYSLREPLIEQQAIYYGWSSGDKLEYIKNLFSAIRSINCYSFCKYDYNSKRFYGLRVCETLLYLRNLSLNDIFKPLQELEPAKHQPHHVILRIIGLSPLIETSPIPQDEKDRALMKAARFLAAPICLKLLESGANPNYMLQRTCFHEVVIRGQVALAETFLKFKADPTINTLDFESTLQIAVESGSMKMLELILSTGAQDLPTLTGTAFSKALATGKIDMAKKLKEQAEKHCRDSANNSYLHLAIMRPEETWMLENFDPTPYLNTLNFPKMTPLHVAVNNKNVQGITYLLAHGASPHIRGILGKTALEMSPDNLRPLFGRDAKRRRANAPR